MILAKLRHSLFAPAVRATPITDAGLKELAALRGLQELDLNNTQVTDAGLKERLIFKTNFVC